MFPGAIEPASKYLDIAWLLVRIEYGAVMLYCFWLIITSTAFWFVRINEIADLFTGLYADGRWPVDIYPNWLRYGLTFLVPASALAGRLSLQTWLDTLTLTVALFTITRFICSVGLKNYSGRRHERLD